MSTTNLAPVKSSSGRATVPGAKQDVAGQRLTDQVTLVLPEAPTPSGRLRNDAGNLAGFTVGLTNFKDISGSNWGDDLEAAGPSFVTDGRDVGTTGSFDGLSDGVSFRADHRRVLRLHLILDGTSKHVMIGEDVPDKLCREKTRTGWLRVSGRCAG
ncbi:MAG: hypothetical protein FJ271_29535 [Planctomycetes bacterium]|nr:hypothetical protein [Planctomycetota bacterium]